MQRKCGNPVTRMHRPFRFGRLRLLVLLFLCSSAGIGQLLGDPIPEKCLEPIGLYSTASTIHYDVNRMSRVVAVPCEGGNLLFLFAYMNGNPEPLLAINTGGLGVVSAVMDGSIHVIQVGRGSTSTFYVIEFAERGNALRDYFTTRDDPEIVVRAGRIQITVTFSSSAIDEQPRTAIFTYKTR